MQQLVCGYSKKECNLILSYSPPESLTAFSLTPVYSPPILSMHSPFSIANCGPSGSTLAAALPSNQFIAPQSDTRSGEITHTLVGAKL